MKHGRVLPTNYEAIRKDRIDGGVLIAVKNTLISQDLEIKSDCEIVVSRIECSKKKKTFLIVISVYRPTNDNFVYAHALTNTIIDTCNKYPMDTIWVFGDMNLPDID